MTLSATAAAALVACGGSVADDRGTTSGDGDTTHPTHPATECPKTQPAAGDACSGTLSCDYSICGAGATGHFFQCVDGRFVDRGGASCNPPAPDCPPTRPPLGTTCSGGTFRACSYPDTCVDRPAGASGVDLLTCSGVWHLASDYVATCPSTPPIDGTSCTCGDHHYGRCTYGDCYGMPTTDARCDATTGVWRVTISTCNPPPPDFDAGGIEAGSGEAGTGTAEAGHT